MLANSHSSVQKLHKKYVGERIRDLFFTDKWEQIQEESIWAISLPPPFSIKLWSDVMAIIFHHSIISMNKKSQHT